MGVILLFMNMKKYRVTAGIDIEDEVFECVSSIEEGMNSDHSGYASEEYDEEDEGIYFSQAKGFRLQFWILFLIVILLYGSVQPFFHICTGYFLSGKWPQMDVASAGMSNLVSL